MEKKRKGGSPPGEDIHSAARNGDLSMVQSICLSDPLAVNSRDKHSRTPLHLAAWAGQLEVVSYLCKNKADTGAAAMDDMSAIHFAAQKGHLEVVRILLMSGVSVKATNRKGFTPLHYAAQGSHLELAKLLIRKGSSLSCKNKSGKTPLDLANNEETRSLLVECESDFLKSKEAKSSKEEDDIAEERDGGDLNSEVDAKREKEQVHKEDEENGRETKRPKVTLNHLLAGDDDQDLEEEK